MFFNWLGKIQKEAMKEEKARKWGNAIAWFNMRLLFHTFNLLTLHLVLPRSSLISGLLIAFCLLQIILFVLFLRMIKKEPIMLSLKLPMVKKIKFDVIKTLVSIYSKRKGGDFIESME